MGDLLRRRPPSRRLTAAVAPAPEAQPHEGETLAERYGRMAHEGYEPRTVDLALRGMDMVIAGVVLAAFSPVMAVVAAAIRRDSGAPVLYRGLRVGRGGRVFTMFKFRTLNSDAETRLGPYLGEELTRLTQDETTRVGRLLRASHLDELPQLFNVVAGDMSIVGPRPIRPAFFEQLCGKVPQYWQRLVIPPGMTGLAQLRITREMTWEEKLAHDFEYIADRSPRLYVQVVLDTLTSLPDRIRGGS